MAEVIKPSFVFVNDTPHSSEASASLNRKLVRAQAARQQSNAQKNQPGQQGVKSAAKWNNYQARKRNRHQTTRNTFQLDLDSLSVLPPTSNSEVKDESDRSSSTANAQDGYPTPKLSKASTEASADPKESGTCSEVEESVSRNVLPSSSDQAVLMSPRVPGAGWSYPFVPPKCYNHPYTPMLMHHYLTNLATDIPELDAGDPGILRSRWFPMVMTADATFNIVLLTAASHFAVFKNKIGDPHIKEILLYLKCQTYAAVQHLIKKSSPELRSDALIGAVAKLASYEAMFGTPELYHLHIRNLQIMITERGGLDTLGLGGLLQRMVLWIDINSAFLLNSAAYFLPRVPLAGHVIRQPNPSGFLGENSFSQAV